MARYAIIEDGIVTNLVEATAKFAKSQGWIACPDADIGWSYDGEKFTPPPAPEGPSQFEKDQSRYQKRAAVKDELVAYMAADNMSRVRAGEWTVADLTGLLADPAVASANQFMSTLSFELAAQAIASAATPLLTPAIRADWIARLQAAFFTEG